VAHGPRVDEIDLPGSLNRHGLGHAFGAEGWRVGAGIIDLPLAGLVATLDDIAVGAGRHPEDHSGFEAGPDQILLSGDAFSAARMAGFTRTMRSQSELSRHRRKSTSRSASLAALSP
jgi:hypothetical protein